MAWTWRYEKADGTVTGQSEEHQNQGDAESWIGEEWRGLLDSGIDKAVLLEDDSVIYSMSLHEG
ncbi:hypothetical protein ABT095_16680 [Kitasatospora sp. NPDC002227]|uniref:hypothetical protein n=1 Tax=Kitasatospora sp. NPDC002227 TaxID=3154773 RepID=UPI003328E039